MPMAGLTAPEATHVEQLIAFARHWDRRGPLVIHCWAGISRSTAAAFATVCALNPQTSEAVIARDLRTASPHANPNRLLIALADEALGRGGRMIAAIEAMAPVSALASEGTPFLMASRYEFDRSSTGSF